MRSLYGGSLLKRLEHLCGELGETPRKQFWVLVDLAGHERRRWRVAFEDLFAPWEDYSVQELASLSHSLGVTAKRHARRADYVFALSTYLDRRMALVRKEKDAEEWMQLGPPGRFEVRPDPRHDNKMLKLWYSRMSLAELKEEASERAFAQFQLDGDGAMLRRCPATRGVPGAIAQHLRHALQTSDDEFVRNQDVDPGDMSARSLRDLLSSIGVSRGDGTQAGMIQNFKKFRVRRSHFLFHASYIEE